MADLTTEVQNRYSAEKLIQLTNPDNPAALTLDATRLASAVADVLAAFDVYANTTFDQTDTRHIFIGCEGVILVLQMRQLNVDPTELRKQWIGMLEALGQSVGGRTKTAPTSDAVAQPSSEQAESGQTVRPLFDRTRFDRYAPQPPGASDFTGLPSDKT